MSEIKDEDVKVITVRCSRCGDLVIAAVQHTLQKSTKKEIGELAAEGHKVETIPLMAYRKKISGAGLNMCNTKCNSSFS